MRSRDYLRAVRNTVRHKDDKRRTVKCYQGHDTGENQREGKKDRNNETDLLEGKSRGRKTKTGPTSLERSERSKN